MNLLIYLGISGILLSLSDILFMFIFIFINMSRAMSSEDLMSSSIFRNHFRSMIGIVVGFAGIAISVILITIGILGKYL
jgi:hypothetical protein